MRRARFAGRVRPHPRSGRGIRHPVGRIATAGRRPCSGSEPEAQRTPGGPCPAVAIVIFGRISSLAGLRQVLLRDQEPKRGSARRWNVKTQIGAIATRSSGPFLAREGRRKRQTKAPPDPGTQPRPNEATRSPAEAGPKSGRKRPKRGKSRLPESRDRREVFLAGSGRRLVDRGDKPKIRSGGCFPRPRSRSAIGWVF